MKVKMILPALTEAKSPYFRPIKYSLFPPLGLATLAGYLAETDSIELQDEHVEPLILTDRPDLVVIECYVTSAHRSYQLADHYRAKGAYVCIGGVHPTSMPDEAIRHADTVFSGPGEDTWPAFLSDLRAGSPRRFYQSKVRTLEGAPPVRRDLIKREKYLVPNSLVISRGCPHRCDFCYKESFFRGGRSFYTQPVDDALEQIESLPGKHLYFLDDNLFANPRFASRLFEGMRGMGRLWQAGATVQALQNESLLDQAVACGLSSLFVGFETLNSGSLKEQNKHHNRPGDYDLAVSALHDRNVMINASFVYGMDHDDPTVFDRTVDWAVESGIETATFHVMTPYPGTELHRKLKAQGRILTENWDRYDTRHAVYQPARMSPAELEDGYWRSYQRFYSWNNIVKAAGTKSGLVGRLRHLAYTGGWKKFEFLWNPVIKSGLLGRTRPLLEKVLSVGSRPGASSQATSRQKRPERTRPKLMAA